MNVCCQSCVATTAARPPSTERRGSEPARIPPIGNRGHHTCSEERLDLRRKQQPVTLARPVKRADPKTVARQKQASLALIPKCDRKLPEHLPLTLLPKMRDDFGVTMFYEAMPPRFQLRPLLEVIE